MASMAFIMFPCILLIFKIANFAVVSKMEGKYKRNPETSEKCDSIPDCAGMTIAQAKL